MVADENEMWISDPINSCFGLIEGKEKKRYINNWQWKLKHEAIKSDILILILPDYADFLLLFPICSKSNV